MIDTKAVEKRAAGEGIVMRAAYRWVFLLRKGAAVFAACLSFLCFSLYFSLYFFGGAPVFAADQSAWTWKVLVVPPDEGWESAVGESVHRILLWRQDEISKSGEGILGHDIEFVLLPATDEDAVLGYSLPIDARTVAVMSFASYSVDKRLITLAAGSGVPLLLAGGENVSLFEQDRLLPYAFALDLYRDYRTTAFAGYAAKTLRPESRLGVMGARFTLNEEREAKICYDLFSAAGFKPMPYWVDASVSDTFSMVEQEIKEASDGVLISYAGSMAAKEIWRGIMGRRSPYRIWYGSAPDKSFLSFKGVLFADQNAFLDGRGGFDALRRELWSQRAASLSDRVAAGRANALVFWLIEAMKTLPRETERIPKGVLFPKLEAVTGIPFGDQTLDADVRTHRPKRRRTFIFEVRNRSFFLLDTAETDGQPYADY
ncbi:MAG: hypothetical protein LBC93_04455 [Synergistaceae bacterium]|nr:hypothetical protein [Synergistaceae bacterium]